MISTLEITERIIKSNGLDKHGFSCEEQSDELVIRHNGHMAARLQSGSCSVLDIVKACEQHNLMWHGVDSRFVVDQQPVAEKMKERTCVVCGHRGTDVTEQPTYDAIFGRDSTDYFCVDAQACLNRQDNTGKYRRL